MLLNIGKNENISQIDINNTRAKKWKQMKNETTLRLPLDEGSFYQHMLRAKLSSKDLV